MRKFLPLLLLLVSPAVALGQRVTLPAEVTAKPGEPAVSVKADTDCESIQWYLIDYGPFLVPPDLLKDSKTAIVILPYKEGRYRILAYGAREDTPSAPAICTIIVGNVPPPPPPGPGPTPPPGPNPPVPPNPSPDDAILKYLQAAYDSDPDPEKKAKLTKLANILEVAAKTCHDPQITSLARIIQSVRIAANAEVGVYGIAKLRDAVATQIDMLGFPSDPTLNLDQGIRDRCKDCYTKVATCLRGIKP